MQSDRKFRQILMCEVTNGFDVLPLSCTVASVCMNIFKGQFLRAKQLAIVPERGYERNDRASVFAIKYLDWLAKDEGVRIQHAGKNCFTDFHIDFGGSSVWYHILKSEKMFWIIEPTVHNVGLFENWIQTRNENSCFFGELVSKCARVRLCQGHTLIIPSGWIHCVYTPVDSLVFGGNFLHSFSIPMQIRVSEFEDRTQAPPHYRFPHFEPICWYYVAFVVLSATGRIYQKKLPEEAHIKPKRHHVN